ncbi:phosphatidylinositol 4-kinase alpha-like isoform X1 [Gordionus sp. m RMFG-2023]|uniref:phosphatidylinositol 4-kinase alpha-like isoform X1 n=5 Tax=Gordionus sp. m RMFG-2023 TaxID=3053472 RepID=UPI0031FD2FAE
MSEEFAFCIGSFLNEIYVRDDTYKEQILNTLFEILNKLIDICHTLRTDYQNGRPIEESSLLILVPVMIGIFRTIGQPTFLPQAGGGPNVFTEIFPSSFPYSTLTSYPLARKFSGHSNIAGPTRIPLFPGISSSNFATNNKPVIQANNAVQYYSETNLLISDNNLNATQLGVLPQLIIPSVRVPLTLFKDAPFGTRKNKALTGDSKLQSSLDGTDPNSLKPELFFFGNNIHGTFCQYASKLYPNKKDQLVRPRFSADQVVSCLNIVKRLLDKELLSALDIITINFSNTTHYSYIYSSYKEIMNYTCLTFLHNVLLNYTKPSVSLMDDVHKFTQQLFMAGQAELFSYTHHNLMSSSNENINATTNSKSSEDPNKSSENKVSSKNNKPSLFSHCPSLNHKKFEICVKSNSVCIEILIWAVNKEETVEAFITKLIERLSASYSLRIIIAHMPLLVACLKALGALAEKDSYLAQMIIIPAFLDFLLKPTSPLAKLYKEQEIDIKKKLNYSTFQNGADSNYYTVTSISKLKPKFERQTYQSSNFEILCETAIDNICRSLRSIYQRDKECVQALLASISGRLYYADSSSKDTGMVFHNTILSLGELAIQLRDVPQVMESVLTIFLQRFGHPPSDFLNIIIIRQLGNMLFAASLGTGDPSTDEKIYKEIMDLFIMVIMKTSQNQSLNKSSSQASDISYKRAALEILRTLTIVISNFGDFPIRKIVSSTTTITGYHNTPRIKIDVRKDTIKEEDIPTGLPLTYKIPKDKRIRSYSQDRPKYKSPALACPSPSISNDSWQMDMLLRILEVFVQLGLENQRLLFNSTLPNTNLNAPVSPYNLSANNPSNMMSNYSNPSPFNPGVQGLLTGSGSAVWNTNYNYNTVNGFGGIPGYSHITGLTASNMKAFANAETLGVLIPLVATIMQNIPFVHSPKPRMHKLFRDFWLYCVLLGFAQENSVWPREWFRCVSIIATKSPLLIFKEHLRSDLHYNTAIKGDKLGQNDFMTLKNTLLNILSNKPEIVSYVKQMTFAELSYLLSIYQLETLRVKNSEDTNAVHYMFHYLEDKSIQKDKSGIWECVCSITENVFNVFLDQMISRPKNESTNRSLERHAQFLLVKFNHTSKRIRKVADYCLAKLVDAFPHLLWDRVVLKTMLDLLHLISKSLYFTLDENIEEFFIVPDTTYKIKFMEDMEGRERILQDFTDRCSSIIQEALRWAPVATKSCLKNYINETSASISFDGTAFDYQQHAGLSLALESIMKFSGLNANVSQLMGNYYERWPACVKFDTSKFLSEINLQIRFQGEIEGLKAAYKETGQVTHNLTEKMTQKLVTVSNNFVSQEIFRDTYLKATAMLIFSTELDENLLHQVSWAYINKFTLPSMETVVECWEWLLTTRPDLELKFFREMFMAWDYSLQNKMGIFEDSKEPGSVGGEKMSTPLASRENSPLKPVLPNVAPHLVWIKFVYQRAEVAKYGATCDVDSIFYSFLLRSALTFPDLVGSPHPIMTRHITAVNCRFRLALSACARIQNTSSAAGPANQLIARIREVRDLELRAAVYATAFDYFCTVPQCPVQSNLHLKDDTLVLLKFWQHIVTEKKYLKNISSPYVKDEYEPYSQFMPNANIYPGNTLPVNSLGLGTMSSTKTSQGKVKGLKVVGNPENQESEITKEFMKKRNLLLTLLANEIERFCTWLNPLSNVNKVLPNEDTIVSWKSQTVSDKTWREMAKLAWSISPSLAVYLPLRFTNSKALFEEVSKLVLNNPNGFSHIPEAIVMLITPSRVENDIKELSSIMNWDTSSTPPTIALSFLCNRIYPYHPLIVQYAIKVLSSYPPEVLIFYIPQIVQAVRYDSIGYVSQFLISIAQKSQLLAHQLMWNMKTNQYMDEDSKIKDDALFDKLDYIMFQMTEHFSASSKPFYEREFQFFTQITNVSAVIRPYPKGKERKEACLKALKKIKTKPGCYLPSNPEAYIIDIDYDSATPMQSAAKAPYLARFKVQRCGIKELEKLATASLVLAEQEANDISTSVPKGNEDTESDTSSDNSNNNKDSNTYSKSKNKRRQSLAPLLPASSAFPVYWQAAIFKVGDDVRQDMLALQIITLFKNVCVSVGLDLFLFPYRVVATDSGCGVIECVPDSKSRDQLGRQTDIGLYEYFLKKYGDENSTAFQKARQNFIRSMAGYSVILFLLQIKDRHNGNIMIDIGGHIIHIDFGFLFESSPGGNLGFEPDIKLTDEMVMIMGGKMEAGGFQWFTELCVKGFLAFRPYEEAVVTLVSLMLDTRFSCFRGQTIKLLRSRFASNLSEKEAAQFMIGVIHRSYLNYRTRAYDLLQYYQNQIPY